MNFDAELQKRTAALQRAGLWRDPRVALEPTRPGCLDLTSNDYLGGGAESVSRETLSNERAAPLGAGASRVVQDVCPETRELEEVLGGWLGYEACLIFSSGYAANLGVLAALVQRGDRILSDALNHASIVDGCRLSRGETWIFPHRDLEALEEGLRGYLGGGTCWVVTESYFSMEGDSPDLLAVAALCERYKAQLIVDESHALGVFGQAGRGLCASAGVRPTVLLSGLGKAVCSQGGFVAGSRSLRDWLWNRARTHFFSTGMSPWLARRTRMAVARTIEADGVRSRLLARAVVLQEVLKRAGWQLPSGRHGPLFPVLTGTEQQTLALAGKLRQLGLKVQAIRPPTVPAGLSRIRFALRGNLSTREWNFLIKTLADRVTLSGKGPALLAQEGWLDYGGSVGPTIARSDPQRTSAQEDPERWVVLGCGTDVGKTFVARALVELLGGQGRAVAGVKPIETGVPQPRADQPPAVSGDAKILTQASFHVKHPTPHPLYSYVPPVTPARAARLSKRPIVLSEIPSWLANTQFLPTPLKPALVVETAGGVFSPLGPTCSNLELAEIVGEARWILVAVDRLGVLHELTATLRAMRLRRLAPDWIVLTSPEQPDSSSGTNEEELRRSPDLQSHLDRLIHLPRNDPSKLVRLLRASSLERTRC